MSARKGKAHLASCPISASPSDPQRPQHVRWFCCHVFPVSDFFAVEVNDYSLPIEVDPSSSLRRSREGKNGNAAGIRQQQLSDHQIRSYISLFASRRPWLREGERKCRLDERGRVTLPLESEWIGMVAQTAGSNFRHEMRHLTALKRVRRKYPLRRSFSS